jgi:hypothetical protein
VGKERVVHEGAIAKEGRMCGMLQAGPAVIAGVGYAWMKQAAGLLRRDRGRRCEQSSFGRSLAVRPTTAATALFGGAHVSPLGYGCAHVGGCAE